MAKLNVYIVAYNDNFIEEVNRELSKVTEVVKYYRSKIVKSFHYYVVNTNEPSQVEELVKELKERGYISWFKIERT